jgi:hypothetical protein
MQTNAASSERYCLFFKPPSFWFVADFLCPSELQRRARLQYEQWAAQQQLAIAGVLQSHARASSFAQWSAAKAQRMREAKQRELQLQQEEKQAREQVGTGGVKGVDGWMDEVC